LIAEGLIMLFVMAWMALIKDDGSQVMRLLSLSFMLLIGWLAVKLAR